MDQPDPFVALHDKELLLPLSLGHFSLFSFSYSNIGYLSFNQSASYCYSILGGPCSKCINVQMVLFYSSASYNIWEQIPSTSIFYIWMPYAAAPSLHIFHPSSTCKLLHSGPTCNLLAIFLSIRASVMCFSVTCGFSLVIK